MAKNLKLALKKVTVEIFNSSSIKMGGASAHDNAYNTFGEDTCGGTCWDLSQCICKLTDQCIQETDPPCNITVVACTGKRTCDVLSVGSCNECGSESIDVCNVVSLQCDLFTNLK